MVGLLRGQLLLPWHNPGRNCPICAVPRCPSLAPWGSLLPRDPSSPCLCPQVAAMGCCSFALLFDDIDPCMCQADRDVFPSLAQAQASVANEVYQELGQPSVFLFCPTGTACSPAVPAPQTGEPPHTGVPFGCTQPLSLLGAECPGSPHGSRWTPHAPGGALDILGLRQDQAPAGPQTLSMIPAASPLLFPQPSGDALCSLPRILQLSLLSQPQPVLLPADHRPGAAPRDRCHLDR